MSEVLPQSELGRIVTKPLADGFAKVNVANQEALEILALTPTSTVWGGPFGRPIYDRLPGVSEGYRREFFGERGRGFVYIDPQFGSSVGPGSLQVGAWQEDPQVLIVYNGTITWAFGQIETNTLALNLSNVVPNGIQDGSYQIGYYLNRVDPDKATFSKFAVENYSLGASETIYAADAEAKYHPVVSMFSEPSDGSWKPSEFGETGDYVDGSSVTMDFTEAVVAKTFTLVAAETGLATALCALYSSDDAIVWNLEDSVAPRNNEWILNCGLNDGARYYRLFFWGGEADISEVRYTGEAIFRDRQPVVPRSEAELFLEGEFDQIDRPHLVLAIVTVSNYEITEIRDTRSQTSIKYEPVASWLTEFQDSSLRFLITSIENYSSLYMAPTATLDTYYERLLEENFVFESETKTPVITFPSSIELEDGWILIGDALLETDPLVENLAVDPSGLIIDGQEIAQFQSNSSVTPFNIILLAEPTAAEDLATKVYADIALIPSLDNGQY
jgi:hypothetical protein